MTSSGMEPATFRLVESALTIAPPRTSVETYSRQRYVYDVMYSGRISPFFRWNVLSQFLWSRNTPSIDIKQRLAVFLVYFSALKVEAIRSSETSVKFTELRGVICQ
jgi:hypothetical protein